MPDLNVERETAVAFVWQRLELGLSVISAAGAILAFMLSFVQSFQGFGSSSAFWGFYRRSQDNPRFTWTQSRS